MAAEQNGSRNVMVVEKQSFLKDEIKLKKLQKKLNKESEEALEVLVLLMNTTEDQKLKAQCARDILNFTVSVNKEINTDQIQRLVAEYRLGNGGGGKLVPQDSDEDEKPARPTVNFNEIKKLD